MRRNSSFEQFFLFFRFNYMPNVTPVFLQHANCHIELDHNQWSLLQFWQNIENFNLLHYNKWFYNIRQFNNCVHMKPRHSIENQPFSFHKHFEMFKSLLHHLKKNIRTFLTKYYFLSHLLCSSWLCIPFVSL